MSTKIIGAEGNKKKKKLTKAAKRKRRLKRILALDFLSGIFNLSVVDFRHSGFAHCTESLV